MKRRVLLIFLMCLTTYTCISQQDEITSFETDEINLAQVNLNFLSVVNSNQLNPNYNSSSFVDNSVFILQVGEFNKAFSKTQSNTSNLEMMQFGDYNNIDLNINAPIIEGTVLQKGNNNSVIDHIYYTNQNVQLNVIQNGDNLSVNRIGANSLSNKLQLVQEGSFKSITIISK